MSGSVLQPVAGARAAGTTPQQSAACSRTPASGVQGPRPGQAEPGLAGSIAQSRQQASEQGSAQAEAAAARELGGTGAAGSGPTEAEAGHKAELLAAEVPANAVPAAAVVRLAGRRESAPVQRRALAAAPGVAEAARHRRSMPAGAHLPAQQAGCGGRASGSPRLLIVSRPSSGSPAAACGAQSAQRSEAQQALSNVAQVAGAEDGGQVGAAGRSGWPIASFGADHMTRINAKVHLWAGSASQAVLSAHRPPVLCVQQSTAEAHCCGRSAARFPDRLQLMFPPTPSVL